MKIIDMTFRQKFLNVLANPNIAYILLILGFWGLLYEITHPGAGISGVLGAIFLILAFYSMQTLPTNYAGLALIILGLVLFIVEAFIPGMGLPTIGGVISMVLGSLILFDTSIPEMNVSISVILAFTLTTVGITLFLLKMVLRTHKRRVVSGKEALIGVKGEAQTNFNRQKEGKVMANGILWNAICEEDLKKGDKVEVEEVNNMVLKVKKL